MAIFKMVNFMEKEHLNGLIEKVQQNIIKVIIQVGKKMEKVNFILVMAIFIVDFGKVGNQMEKVYMKLKVENTMEIGVQVFLCN